MLIFTAALHTVTKMQTSPTCPLTDDNKIHTGLFSTMKKNTVLMHATTRINLGNHMLKEGSQTREDKCYMSPLT